VFRIGLLGTFPPAPEVSDLWEGFFQGLRELGYVVGENIVIEGLYSEGRTERLPALAAELVRLKVDVIVAGAGRPTPHAAQHATSTIPIVMTTAGDPVGTPAMHSARPAMR
jgi:putative ABC transport system substrate-binding protein